MITKYFSRFSSRVLFFILSFAVFTPAYAGVTVYDDITTPGKAVKLKAVTKGLLFPEGGKLVTFYLDGKPVGTTLSGGDGYAFLKYVSSSKGIKHLKTQQGSDTDEGVLLITGREDNVLAVEIEGVLFIPELKGFLQPAEKGRKVLEQLSKKFRIIYLTTLIGVKKSRKWLQENGFPLSPVLQWEGSDTITELQSRQIRLSGIVASPAVISESSDIKKRFSFEDTEDGVALKSWEDLLKQLEKEKAGQ